MLIYAIAVNFLRVASTVKPGVESLVAGCHFPFFLSMRKLFFCFMHALSLFVRGGRHFHEDQCQQREDQGLHQGHEDLERDKYHISQSGYQESKDGQHCTACEDVAKETESKREQAGNLGHKFDQSDKDFNRSLEGAMRE